MASAAHVEHGTADRLALSTTLADLVGDVSQFFERFWSTQPHHFRSMGDFAGLISEGEIWDEVDCGLLSRPYFTVFDEGVRAAIGDISESRRVVGHVLSGFANSARIRADFAAGATFKLNQVEHWHPRIGALVDALRPEFRGELEAFVFLSPPGKTAMRAHTDGAHVIVLQLAGEKDWVIGRLTERSHSDSTLHDGEINDTDRVELTMRAGDVLYLPHGCPHFATARGGNSIHLAITIEEPNAVDLASVYLARFLRTAPFADLERQYHVLPPRETLRRLYEGLSTFLRDEDPSTVLEAAVKLRRGSS